MIRSLSRDRARNQVHDLAHLTRMAFIVDEKKYELNVNTGSADA